MSKLRLGPLPKNETVRLVVTLPAQVKADLDHYAELYSAAYGDAVDSSALAAHMIAAFMERDRGFRTARRVARTAPNDAETSTNAAVMSNAKDTSDDALPSQ